VEKNEKMAVPKSGAPIPLPPVLNNTGRGFIHPSFFQGGIFPGFPPCNSSMVAIDLSTMAFQGPCNGHLLSQKITKELRTGIHST